MKFTVLYRIYQRSNTTLYPPDVVAISTAMFVVQIVLQLLAMSMAVGNCNINLGRNLFALLTFQYQPNVFYMKQQGRKALPTTARWYAQHNKQAPNVSVRVMFKYGLAMVIIKMPKSIPATFSKIAMKMIHQKTITMKFGQNGHRMVLLLVYLRVVYLRRDYHQGVGVLLIITMTQESPVIMMNSRQQTINRRNVHRLRNGQIMVANLHKRSVLHLVFLHLISIVIQLQSLNKYWRS